MLPHTRNTCPVQAQVKKPMIVSLHKTMCIFFTFTCICYFCEKRAQTIHFRFRTAHITFEKQQKHINNRNCPLWLNYYHQCLSSKTNYLSTLAAVNIFFERAPAFQSCFQYPHSVAFKLFFSSTPSCKGRLHSVIKQIKSKQLQTGLNH